AGGDAGHRPEGARRSVQPERAHETRRSNCHAHSRRLRGRRGTQRDLTHLPPSVIAHRGAWGADVPENSLAAFEQAIDLGADMIEFDVRRTRDRELIVFHDAEVAGAPVASLTRPEIED